MEGIQLLTIPSSGRFGNAVNQINLDFSRLKVAVDSLSYATRSGKGLFADAAALAAAIPTPTAGDWALVGESFPAAIYIVSGSSWVDSGQTYSGDNVDLNNYVTLAQHAADIASVTDVNSELSLKDNSNTFYIVDVDGNIIAQVDADGVKANKYHLLTTSGDNVATITTKVGVKIVSLTDLMLENESGLYFCDANGNYKVYISADGTLDAVAIGAKLTALIENIAASSGGGSSTESFSVPSYLQSEYDATMQKVQSLSSSNTFSFAFMTDIHTCCVGQYTGSEDNLRNGVKNAFGCLAKMSKQLPLRTTVLGGDYVQLQRTASVTKQDGIDVMMEVNEWASAIDSPLFVLAGNHEQYYHGDTSVSSVGISDNEVYNLLSLKGAHGNIKKASNKVWYQIDDAAGVVYVYVTTVTQGELSSLTTAYDAVIAANTDNYPLIVFNHFGSSWDKQQLVEYIWDGVKDAIDYLKTNGATLIAWVAGHNHGDYCMVYNSTIIVTCLQAGLWTKGMSQDGVEYEHTINTATESAYTIITINKTLGKLYCTRFGLGRDREINYNSTSGTIGAVTYD